MAIIVNGKKVAGVGRPGAAGADGKSAYTAAVEGGYQGTESEFNAVLSDGATKTFVAEEINKAIGAALEASY